MDMTGTWSKIFWKMKPFISWLIHAYSLVQVFLELVSIAKTIEYSCIFSDYPCHKTATSEVAVLYGYVWICMDMYGYFHECSDARESETDMATPQPAPRASDSDSVSNSA